MWNGSFYACDGFVPRGDGSDRCNLPSDIILEHRGDYHITREYCKKHFKEIDLKFFKIQGKIKNRLI